MSAKEKYLELDAKVKELENQKFALSKEVIKEDQEKLRPLVGLCFTKYIGEYKKYYKVIDVPHEHYLGNTKYDPFMIPVIELSNQSLTIKHTEIHSRAVEADDPVKFFKKEYKLCTEKQFNTQLDKITKRIKDI